MGVPARGSPSSARMTSAHASAARPPMPREHGRLAVTMRTRTQQARVVVRIGGSAQAGRDIDKLLLHRSAGEAAASGPPHRQRRQHVHPRHRCRARRPIPTQSRSSAQPSRTPSVSLCLSLCARGGAWAAMTHGGQAAMRSGPGPALALARVRPTAAASARHTSGASARASTVASAPCTTSVCHSTATSACACACACAGVLTPSPTHGSGVRPSGAPSVAAASGRSTVLSTSPAAIPGHPAGSSPPPRP
jgi:hypothetical protein